MQDIPPRDGEGLAGVDWMGDHCATEIDLLVDGE